jgi:flagellar motor switch protein FliG
MFTFEDLLRLDPSGVQTLMRQVDKDRLTMALKGASEDLKKLFFGAMSNRASKLMKEDMAAMGPVRLSEVEEAQTAIITVAKDLTEKGEIVLDDGSSGSDTLIE